MEKEREGPPLLPFHSFIMDRRLSPLFSALVRILIQRASTPMNERGKRRRRMGRGALALPGRSEETAKGI